MATGEEEGRQSRGSQSRSNSKALLVLVHLAVPAAPDLEGSKHATATAHVTIGTLARAAGSATRDTGNTGDGTTGT